MPDPTFLLVEPVRDVTTYMRGTINPSTGELFFTQAVPANGDPAAIQEWHNARRDIYTNAQARPLVEAVAQERNGAHSVRIIVGGEGSERAVNNFFQRGREIYDPMKVQGTVYPVHQTISEILSNSHARDFLGYVPEGRPTGRITWHKGLPAEDPHAPLFSGNAMVVNTADVDKAVAVLNKDIPQRYPQGVDYDIYPFDCNGKSLAAIRSTDLRFPFGSKENAALRKAGLIDGHTDINSLSGDYGAEIRNGITRDMTARANEQALASGRVSPGPTDIITGSRTFTAREMPASEFMKTSLSHPPAIAVREVSASEALKTYFAEAPTEAPKGTATIKEMPASEAMKKYFPDAPAAELPLTSGRFAALSRLSGMAGRFLLGLPAAIGVGVGLKKSFIDGAPARGATEAALTTAADGYTNGAASALREGRYGEAYVRSVEATSSGLGTLARGTNAAVKAVTGSGLDLDTGAVERLLNGVRGLAGMQDQRSATLDDPQKKKTAPPAPGPA